MTAANSPLHELKSSHYSRIATSLTVGIVFEEAAIENSRIRVKRLSSTATSDSSTTTDLSNEVLTTESTTEIEPDTSSGQDGTTSLSSTSTDNIITTTMTNTSPVTSRNSRPRPRTSTGTTKNTENAATEFIKILVGSLAAVTVLMITFCILSALMVAWGCHMKKHRNEQRELVLRTKQDIFEGVSNAASIIASHDVDLKLPVHNTINTSPELERKASPSDLVTDESDKPNSETSESVNNKNSESVNENSAT